MWILTIIFIFTLITNYNYLTAISEIIKNNFISIIMAALIILGIKFSR